MKLLNIVQEPYSFPLIEKKQNKKKTCWFAHLISH